METMMKADPVGIHEIAARLGVKLVTVRMWRWQGDKGEGPPLPAADYQVSNYDAWEWENILLWAGATGHLDHAPNADSLRRQYREATGKEPRAQYTSAGKGTTNEPFLHWVGKLVRHKDGTVGRVREVRAHQPRLLVDIPPDRTVRWHHLDVEEVK